MRFTALLLLSLSLLGFSGCGLAGNRQKSSAQQSKTEPAEPNVLEEKAAKFYDSIETEKVSLDQANAANASSQAIERKIIRNANLTLEVASPMESQRKIASIAETHQGFVVTSESTQRTNADKTQPEITVTLVVRVPAAQFNQTMEEIRAAGMRVVREKITGQDVTEEFMDLEARIKNQKALEAQFIEIMKRAGTVEDALNVQRELANVRTEIERLEGRRRFLANQTSLSTINVTLQSPTQIVDAAGFWYSIKTAFADGLEAAGAIVLFLIRVVVAMLPLLLLIVLPVALVAKFVIKRLARKRTERINEDRVTASE